VVLTVDGNSQGKAESVGNGDTDSGAGEGSWAGVDHYLSNVLLLEIFSVKAGEEEAKNILVSRRVDLVYKFFVV